MLYRNCRELPMHNFNEIQITNDLNYLVKDKKSFNSELLKESKEILKQWNKESEVENIDKELLISFSKNKQLERHWIDILEESFKLSKDNTQKKFFRDRAELMFLEMKLNILSSIAEIEHLELTKEQCAIINSLKKKYKVKDLQQAILETTDKVNIKISHFKRQYNTEKSGNFDSVLASMRINGYHVNRHEITVAEWFALVEQVKAQNAKQKPQRRR